MPSVLTPASPKLYLNPTRRVLSAGAFAQLPEILQSFSPKTILLALGEHSFRRSSYFQKMQEFLKDYTVIEASPISQNPTQAFIQEEINRLKGKHYELVLAIGGGSVLDVSKLLAAIPRQTETRLEKYFQAGFAMNVSPAPIIAIPTTSGTGSEVTPYASLETSDKKKVTVSYPQFFPAVAIIDPELTYTMPEYVTASTGFDALSQAIESFWAVSATAFSQTHALRAIEQILSGLEIAYENPASAEARYAMAVGSCEAGLAIAHTKTTAVHSVSYPITAHFGVAHGHACALTLAPFIRFNAVTLKEQGKPMLRLFGVDSYEQAADKVERLMQAVKLERSLQKLGIDAQGRALILKDGFRPDRILNNPRKVEASDLEKILASIA